MCKLSVLGDDSVAETNDAFGSMRFLSLIDHHGLDAQATKQKACVGKNEFLRLILSDDGV